MSLVGIRIDAVVFAAAVTRHVSPVQLDFPGFFIKRRLREMTPAVGTVTVSLDKLNILRLTYASIPGMVSSLVEHIRNEPPAPLLFTPDS